MDGPERAFFWDATNRVWRPALTDEPGDLVWNTSTRTWEPGAIGGNWKWNTTSRCWEPGPGGTHTWTNSTKSWDAIEEATYGGGQYWNGTSWVPNTGSPGVGVNDLLLENGEHLLLETGDALLMES